MAIKVALVLVALCIAKVHAEDDKKKDDKDWDGGKGLSKVDWDGGKGYGTKVDAQSAYQKRDISKYIGVSLDVTEAAITACF